MNYAFVILCLAVAFLLFVASLIIVAVSVVRGQRISQHLRLIGGFSQMASFAVGAVGIWSISGTSIGALPFVVCVGIGFGALCSWGFLVTQPPDKRQQSRERETEQ